MVKYKGIIILKDRDISGKTEFAESFSLSRHTTYGVGGACKMAYFPQTEKEAVKIFQELQKDGEKFFVLGCGSNILAADGFFDGSVIATSRLNKITKRGSNLSCQSGVTVAQLLKFCVENGLGGLEFLAGIPASLGGVTFMNAGACGRNISDVLVSCRVFDGELHVFSNKLCNFGYKYSTMRGISCIILSSTFKTEPCEPKKVKQNINNFLKERSIQPKGKSCGCVFKNPEGLSAGKIIEDCGLKGVKLGGATVSPAHANFIMNEGASAADIYALIHLIKDKVFDKYGIYLEEEVVYIGEFNDTFG